MVQRGAKIYMRHTIKMRLWGDRVKKVNMIKFTERPCGFYSKQFLINRVAISPETSTRE